MSPSEHVDAMALEHLGEAYTLATDLQKCLDVPKWDAPIIDVVRDKVARLVGLIHIIHENKYHAYTGDEAVVPHLEQTVSDSYVRVAAEDSYATAA